MESITFTAVSDFGGGIRSTAEVSAETNGLDLETVLSAFSDFLGRAGFPSVARVAVTFESGQEFASND